MLMNRSPVANLMTKQTYRHITCFYCKYEIVNKKCIKLVKYKGKKRPICQHCTKSKHKTLEKKYQECDIQCKSCDKPVMYKKCIACSTCDHFFHGKCLDLNKDDIIKIDTVCNFFICPHCSNNLFPSTEILDYNKKHTPKQKINILCIR